jgi:hypothetical protein
MGAANRSNCILWSLGLFSVYRQKNDIWTVTGVEIALFLCHMSLSPSEYEALPLRQPARILCIENITLEKWDVNY